MPIDADPSAADPSPAEPSAAQPLAANASPAEPSAGTGTDSGADPATASAGAGMKGMLGPLVLLLVVAALALAAMTGGAPEEDGAAGTAVSEEPEAATGEVDEELAVEQDPGQQEAVEEPLAQEEARAQLAALASREPDDPRALGAVDAPVVMVQWADFLCPFCGVFARDTEPELIDRYVESGVLRIEWRDLPFQGEGAQLAAIGGQAAAEQDAFWDYHDALFAADLRSSDGRMSREFLLEVAADLDLDVGAFDAALDDPALAERVEAEAVQAQSLGITGTPAFIVGGYPLVGAQPLEAFVDVIENAAIEAGAELP